MENFREIAERFDAPAPGAGSPTAASSPRPGGVARSRRRGDGDEGERARRLVAANRGALRERWRLLEPLLRRRARGGSAWLEGGRCRLRPRRRARPGSCSTAAPTACDGGWAAAGADGCRGRWSPSATSTGAAPARRRWWRRSPPTCASRGLGGSRSSPAAIGGAARGCGSSATATGRFGPASGRRRAGTAGARSAGGGGGGRGGDSLPGRAPGAPASARAPTPSSSSSTTASPTSRWSAISTCWPFRPPIPSPAGGCARAVGCASRSSPRRGRTPRC